VRHFLPGSEKKVDGAVRPQSVSQNKSRMSAALQSFVFQLPTFGSPMCLGAVKKDDEYYKQMREGVDGHVDDFPKKDFVIHPMFRENPRWELAAKLLAIADIVYVNDNGANECSVNTATIITNPAMRIGGCPHLFGNVLLVVSKAALDKAKITNYLSLVLVAEFEPEDEEEEAAMLKDIAEKGYDYYESSGQVFLCKV